MEIYTIKIENKPKAEKLFSRVYRDDEEFTGSYIAFHGLSKITAITLWFAPWALIIDFNKKS